MAKGKTKAAPENNASEHIDKTQATETFQQIAESTESTGLELKMYVTFFLSLSVVPSRVLNYRFVQRKDPSNLARRQSIDKADWQDNNSQSSSNSAAPRHQQLQYYHEDHRKRLFQ